MKTEITESQTETCEVRDMNMGEPFMVEDHVWVRIEAYDKLMRYTRSIENEMVVVVCLETGTLHTMEICRAVYPLDGGFVGSKRLAPESV